MVQLPDCPLSGRISGKTSTQRDQQMRMIASFIIHYLGWQAGIAGRLPQTTTIRSLVCSREMHPLAFLDPRAFTGTDSRKTFRPPTTSFLKAYSSTVAIDGGFQYGPTSHDPTRALGGVDGVGAFGGTGTRVNGCPSPSDVSNSAF